MSNKVAILDPATALATEQGWHEQRVQWETILTQGVLPRSTDTVAKCIAIAKLGAERFGWGPMDSVTKICLVEGKIELYSTTMMELMQKRLIEEGGYLIPVERSKDRAAIEIRRKGWPRACEIEFTQEDAKHAGLWGRTSKSGKKMPWSAYEKDMLWNKCVSRVSRSVCADITGGAYSMGEIREAQEAMETVTVEQVGEGIRSIDDFMANRGWKTDAAEEAVTQPEPEPEAEAEVEETDEAQPE